jgi:hypothetical protein
MLLSAHLLRALSFSLAALDVAHPLPVCDVCAARCTSPLLTSRFGIAGTSKSRAFACASQGVSWHCSQKIHNQVYGFERAMHCCEYVIVLDDDIKLHPGTIRAWVEELESDATALAASGYAFEYVRKGETSFVPYLAMLWRLMASNGFQHPKDRPVNCWGGAMMFRSQELRRNLYRLTDAWCDGGYSEDFITLSTARHHRRTIAVPKTALFPNELGGIQFDRFWNFMCRQVFVLTKTYASGAQRFIAFGGSFFNALAHLSIFLGTLAATPLTLFTAYTLFAPRRSPPGSPAAAAASGPFALLGFDGACASSPAVPSALVFWMLLGVFGYIGQRTMRSFANLCNVLSPHGYGNEPIDVSHIGAVRLCLAYLIYCPLIPAAHIATLLSSSMVWWVPPFLLPTTRAPTRTHAHMDMHMLACCMHARTHTRARTHARTHALTRSHAPPLLFQGGRQLPHRQWACLKDGTQGWQGRPPRRRMVHSSA